MTANTISYNQQDSPLPEANQPVWLFGYGSLIYKVDFPYLESRQASIYGWSRRFWQGSHDHRGTPEQPGLVATLIEHPGAECAGIAYRVKPEVFSHLDVREKNGYLRLPTTLTLVDGNEVEGLVYIATSENPAFEGPADEAVIARRILRSTGPSGSNIDYALELAKALRGMGIHDGHVFAVEKQIRSLAEKGHDPQLMRETES